jgi:hypothetical protein
VQQTYLGGRGGVRGGVRSDSAASPRARGSAAHDDLARPVIWGAGSLLTLECERRRRFFFSFVLLPADRCDDSVVLRLPTACCFQLLHGLFTRSAVGGCFCVPALCFVLVSTRDLSPFAIASY